MSSFFPATIGTPTAVPGSSDWVATRLGGTGTTMDYSNWHPTVTTTSGRVIGGASSSSSTERALGTLTSAAQNPAIGVEIVNNSGKPLVSVSIEFWQENWRMPGSGGGSSTGVQNLTPAEYGTTDSGITSASIFTATSGFTNESSLNLVSHTPVLNAAPFNLDGNLADNRVMRSATISFNSNPIGVGESFFLRFNDVDDVGADGIMAIDDFKFSAVVVPEPSVSVLLLAAFFGLALARKSRSRKN